VEEIFVPASGMAMEEALLTEWLKEPGEPVRAGEAVAVVETDKTSVELSSGSGGILGRHLFAPGSTVKAGATVAYVLAEGEQEPSSKAAPNGDASATSAEPANGHAPVAPAPGATVAARGAPRMLSPRQRRAAALAAVQAPPPSAGFTTPAPAPVGVPAAPAATAAMANDAAGSREDAFRRAGAAQVAESWRTIPHFSVGRDVDASQLTATLAVARRYNRSMTVTDFLLAALGRALAGSGKGTDVGLAVATEWGVLIPVVRDAGTVEMDELARLRERAVERARSRRLGADDSITPYATLSNLGMMDVDWFTGVVPVGQKALLTVGRVADRAVVEGRGIAVRPGFTAILTADHRELDGADSARLLGSFVQTVESLGKEMGA